MIQFIVPGVPVAQPRVKATAFGGHARVYTPKTADAFKASVALAFQSVYKGAPLDGPVRLKVEFLMPRPKAMIWKSRPMETEPHAKKPDLDNLVKACADSLLGLAWIDDSQICELVASKRIAAGDEQPGVFVEIARYVR